MTKKGKNWSQINSVSDWCSTSHWFYQRFKYILVSLVLPGKEAVPLLLWQNHNVWHLGNKPWMTSLLICMFHCLLFMGKQEANINQHATKKPDRARTHWIKRNFRPPTYNLYLENTADIIAAPAPPPCGGPWLYISCRREYCITTVARCRLRCECSQTDQCYDVISVSGWAVSWKR